MPMGPAPSNKKTLFLLLLIGSFIFLNLTLETKIFLNIFRELASPRTILIPGEEFFPLRPYLTHVQKAGYYTDRTSPNPGIDVQIMGDYQHAQTALSPTLLDYFSGGLSYEFIVMNCTSRAVVRKKAEEIGGKILAETAEGIALVRRAGHVH